MARHLTSVFSKVHIIKILPSTEFSLDLLLCSSRMFLILGLNVEPGGKVLLAATIVGHNDAI